MHDAHSGHSGHHGSNGFSEPPLPATANLTWGVRIAVLLAILTSIMQGSFVAGSSKALHVWPAADTLKIELPPFNPNP